LLSEKSEELEIIAKELLEKEIIFQSDLERLIGKRPFEKQTTYQAFTNGAQEKEPTVEETGSVEETDTQHKEEIIPNDESSYPEAKQEKTGD
jgi:cell division protease FtsH